MQIEVLDDKSTTGDPEALVTQAGKGRVDFYRSPSNEGSTRMFNKCVERSRGEWVHMLHGDDRVLPGFYEACEDAIATFPDAVMVFSQAVVIDENGCKLSISGPEPGPIPEVMHNFIVSMVEANQCQFAAVAVRRSAYEKAGGFSLRYDYVPDWDMWWRIGQLGKVILLPKPYGEYRWHPASLTRRLWVSGATVKEQVELTQVNFSRLTLEQLACASAYQATWKASLAEAAEKMAWVFDSKDNLEGRLNQMRWAFKLQPTCRRLFNYGKSWLKARLRESKPGRSPSESSR